MRRACAILVFVVGSFVIVVSAPGASVARQWHSCSRRATGVRHLQVSLMTCHAAAKAVARGYYETPPAGPTFRTRGYTCTSPVGPPIDHPRFTVCKHLRKAFRFYGEGEI